jgi:hypothetical protein
MVILHTYMSKDSIKIQIGCPQSTEINNYGYNEEVHETLNFKSSNN